LPIWQPPWPIMIESTSRILESCCAWRFRPRVATRDEDACYFGGVEDESSRQLPLLFVGLVPDGSFFKPQNPILKTDFMY
jgi:hypothetical protein